MDYRVLETGIRARLGEGPLWSPSRQALFWVDIRAPALHRLDMESGAVASWPTPEPIGWIIERAGRDDFIIGIKSGFALLTLDPFAISPIGNPEPDRPHNRLNDAKADPCGRIWAGSMDDREQEVSGALYRLDPDLSWSRQDDGYLVANGPAFSLDGAILYHTDSGRRVIYAFDLAPDGTLSGKRVFITFDSEWGYPDGMTVDAEGGLWVAHWGGGRVSRFRPDGSLERSIRLPATNVTSVAFGGSSLTSMFVTSSADGMDQEDRAGALFLLEPGVAGLPPRGFAG
jgi:D-xylonolactonase